MQHQALRAAGFEGKLRPGGFVVRGPVVVKALSPVYQLRLEYQEGDVPRAWIEHPPLRPRSESEEIPHTYGGERPCLYLPREREWTPEMPLVKTIIPWVTEWLLCYEDWHVTGEWKGGGVHPMAPKGPEPEPLDRPWTRRDRRRSRRR